MLTLREHEEYRIKRAFWRFGLYCALFHRPGTDEASNSASSQSQSYLLDQQCRYIGKFNVWEVEELITVYDYLLTRLESSYDPTSAARDLDRDLM